MEMMPYHPDADRGGRHPEWADPLPTWGPRTPSDWRVEVPTLGGPDLTLRELTLEDAPSLFEQLTTAEVARFISPPPASVAGFEAFIRWAQQRRAQGRYVCWGIVPAGHTVAVGMVQIHLSDTTPETPEWGFALGSAYWGTGVFVAAARRVVDFAFARMGLHRLEARAAVPNGRGHGALRKLGAVREAVLHQSFERHGERLDQVLWTLAREDWWVAETLREGVIH
jgi:[ribosomal protein S5]-alanine N-acetyltransferase